MTKTELIDNLAKETGLTKTQAKEVIETLLTQTTKALKKEGRFVLAGLGTFDVVKRAKRTARNPRTGEPMIVKAHKAVRFKPAKALKEAVN